MKYIRYLDIVLGWLFPLSADQEKFQNMTPSEFGLRAKKPIEQAGEDIHSLFCYKEELVHKAIWELKYRGNKRIVELLASLLHDLIIENLSDEFLFSHFNQPILIPLPLSKERFKERGWNQSELLALELEKKDAGINFTVCCDILEKIRHTLPQTKLNRKERLENLKDCFSISAFHSQKEKQTVRDRNIILIDDVTTTGSSLREAMKVLKEAGARKVIAFTIAH